MVLPSLKHICIESHHSPTSTQAKVITVCRNQMFSFFSSSDPIRRHLQSVWCMLDYVLRAYSSIYVEKCFQKGDPSLVAQINQRISHHRIMRGCKAIREWTQNRQLPSGWIFRKTVGGAEVYAGCQIKIRLGVTSFTFKSSEWEENATSF